MQDPRCKCGEYAIFSVAITFIRTGHTTTMDYCKKCMPAILLEDVKRS